MKKKIIVIYLISINFNELKVYHVHLIQELVFPLPT